MATTHNPPVTAQPTKVPLHHQKPWIPLHKENPPKPKQVQLRQRPKYRQQRNLKLRAASPPQATQYRVILHQSRPIQLV